MEPFATRGEKVFYVANYIFLGLLGLVAVFPFYLVVVRAVAPTSDYAQRAIVLYPSRITWDYFNILFNDPATKIWTAYKNSIFITVVGTLLNLVAVILTAFPLAEKKLPFRSQITFFFLTTMFIGGSLFSNYILYSRLKLLDTLWVLIVPGIFGTYNIILLRNFLMQLPEELIEASIIDGCSQFQTIWYVVLPLSKAALATIGLFCAVGHWSQFGGWIYFISPTKQNLTILQVFLHDIIGSKTKQPGSAGADTMFEDGIRSSPEGLKAAATLAVTVPILCVYPFIQKHFAKGLVIGSLKG